jgi:integrase
MSKSSKPTRYSGVSRVADATFRLRGRVRDPKTGRSIDLDRIVTAASVHEAHHIRVQLLEELQSAQPVRTARPRLRDFATSWLRSKLPTLKAATRTHYAEVLDNHVLPKLGDYYLDAITSDDLVTWRDGMLARGARPATVNSRLRVLKTLLGDAVHEHDLPRDPARRVPAVRDVRAEDDPNCLNEGQLAAVLETARVRAPNWHAFFLTLAYTGLRFGEATALRWDDLDETAGVIRVVRAQWKGKLDTTKTGRVRVVPLAPELAQVLREHRARLLKAQHVGLAEGLVFPSQQRGAFAYMHNTAPRRALAKCCAEAGVGHRFTIHGFRRTFNNLVRRVAEGVVVRSMTGHASIEMTDHYSQVDVREKQAAVAGIVALVAKASSREHFVGDIVGDREVSTSSRG